VRLVMTGSVDATAMRATTARLDRYMDVCCMMAEVFLRMF
jgi:hypothetical protein